ncbi:MAG TPA: SDR family NAD(P)-dependent oxidoreductase [Solirubrobacteraceae bacterium]|jgi:NAD(P)-dependent dehydrogenase (short-subunit alcohol dehydrogenase family)|nr:SDR family NAD(P)-dependent oxidoreductase [Solirubrobacteraceae bacterium]
MPRTALVTGANRGIGRAVAQLLRSEGLAVVVAGRDEASIREVAEALGATPLRVDVRDAAAVEQAAQRAGHVDVLVNNAAILDEGQDPVTEDPERVTAIVDTNLLGAWWTCRAFLPGMLARDWGRIVNVSSGAGSFAGGLWPAAPAYSVSKAALNALTLVLADRLEGTNVKVNAADPGTVATRMAPYASRTPEQAAEHIATLALLPDDGPSGGFFHEGRPEPW